MRDFWIFRIMGMKFGGSVGSVDRGFVIVKDKSRNASSSQRNIHPRSRITYLPNVTTTTPPPSPVRVFWSGDSPTSLPAISGRFFAILRHLILNPEREFERFCAFRDKDAAGNFPSLLNMARYDNF